MITTEDIAGYIENFWTTDPPSSITTTRPIDLHDCCYVYPVNYSPVKRHVAAGLTESISQFKIRASCSNQDSINTLNTYLAEWAKTWSETFENSLDWWTITESTSCTASRSTTQKHGGSYSLKMALGNVGGALITVTREVPKNIDIFTAWVFCPAGPTVSTELKFILRDVQSTGDTAHNAFVVYVSPTLAGNLTVSACNATTKTQIVASTTYDAWHELTVIMDWTAQKYYVYWDDVLKADGYDFYAAVTEATTFLIQNVTTNYPAYNFYVDDVSFEIEAFAQKPVVTSNYFGLDILDYHVFELTMTFKEYE